MTEQRRMVCTIYSYKRIENTRNGNARYRVVTDMGEYLTKPDSDVVQDIKECPNTHVRKCLTLNGRNHITALSEA